MQMRWENVVTSTLVICALVTTTAVVHQVFLTSAAKTSADATQRSIFVKTWRSELGNGVLLGQVSAPIQLIEFADFECPYCGTLHGALKNMQRRYSDQVALTYVHYPLAGHRFALLAARAAECANQQGRFEAMYDQLFERQDQFGLKPWDEYAAAAGVPDMAAFDACIKKTDPIPRVEEGKALGAKLDVKGTPTVIVNGWKLGRPPTEAELDQMVQRVLAGKQPVDGKS
jgi:protein-disulfide isomerase